MFRSLHMKLVLILMLLIISVMAVMGTFLINSVSNFYLDDFQKQIEDVFSKKETENPLVEFENIAREEDGAQKLSERLAFFSAQLGIGTNRIYAVLDKNGNYLNGSNSTIGVGLGHTPNIIAAMSGRVGNSGSMADSQMDYAIPLNNEVGELVYILYIRDNKTAVQQLSQNFFTIVMQSMLFGLLVAIMLSFVLSKTITTPIENITKSALKVSKGDFSERIPIQSNDEIGELTSTFNGMAGVLQHTLEEVQGERDKLNTLFLHMTDGVAAFTAGGRLIHMNPATERLLDISFTENMMFSDMFRGMALPRDKDAGEKGYVQTDLTHAGRTLHVLFAPYGAAEGDGGIITVIHDITEQRKLEDARREFVANVSHELRTPLTNIKSYTETLVDTVGELPPETECKFLGIISNEADRMTRIVSDLLTLSKLDYGRMDLRFTHFSLRTMLEKVHAAMVLQAGNNDHALVLEMDQDLPEMVGDGERLEQVVINILSNAVKYTPRGGHIALIASKQDDSHVMLRVQDNGMGIPAADVPRLFERFYRVDKARSREKGGTGLGLAIAKEMVQAHQGTISLESTEGVGTIVSIILPTNLTAGDEKLL